MPAFGQLFAKVLYVDTCSYIQKGVDLYVFDCFLSLLLVVPLQVTLIT